jgi:F0F1-type ATP synthase assembly protein I
MTVPPRSEGWQGMGTGWSVVSTLVAGLATLGGLGYLADRWLGTGTLLTGIGFVLGGACGVYIVYLRFGKEDRADD